MQGMDQQAAEMTAAGELLAEQQRVNEETFERVRVERDRATVDVDTLSAALRSARMRARVLTAAVEALDQTEPDFDDSGIVAKQAYR